MTVSEQNDFTILPEGQSRPFCITLIGMAAAGKTTIGKILSERLGWILVDTDRLIESFFGMELQALKDTRGVDGFIEAEEQVVAGLTLNRCIISTGGSVVYSPQAMDTLKNLGPVVFLQCSLSTIQKRLRNVHSRGLAIRPDQTIEDLYQERQPLYEAYADLRVPTDTLSAREVADRIEQAFAGPLQEFEHGKDK